MAHLATVGSHAINGVAALHSELLKRDRAARLRGALAGEASATRPTASRPRRFLALRNPRATELITEAIGDSWLTDLDKLRELEAVSTTRRSATSGARSSARTSSASPRILRRAPASSSIPASLFDVQVKRIHEYKRQHLNVLHVIALYHRLKTDPASDAAPRTCHLRGQGRARLPHGQADHPADHTTSPRPSTPTRSSRPAPRRVHPRLQRQERRSISIPAADLSEQISTAGKEASGTGNMKFTLNGALTIGTLDGANVEIREAVGADNFFLFGLTVEQVSALTRDGYRPEDRLRENPKLAGVLDLLASGHFSRHEPDVFRPVADDLRNHDPYMVLADFGSYAACQQRVSDAWIDQDRWTRMSILNASRAGRFSSDRAIREYSDEIWHLPTIRIEKD